MQVNPKAHDFLKRFQVHKELRDRTAELAGKANADFQRVRTVVAPVESAAGMTIQVTIIEQVPAFGGHVWSGSIKDRVLNDLLCTAIQNNMPTLLNEMAELAAAQYRTVLPGCGLVARQILSQVEQGHDVRQSD